MSAAAKAEPAPSPGEVPAEFRIDNLDQDRAVGEARAILQQAGADTRAFNGIVDRLRPVAWRQHLLGGGATGDREHLERLRRFRSQAQGRLGAFKARGLPTQEAEAEIRGQDTEVARYEALVAAAGDAHLDDQKSRQAKVAAATRAVTEARERIGPFRSLPPAVLREIAPKVAELEQAVVVAERNAARAEGEFERGRVELERLGAEVDAHIGKARVALVGCLKVLAGRLGRDGRSLLKGVDLDLVRRFPHQGPDDLLRLAGQAEDLDGICGRLVLGGGGCADAFRSELGGADEEILDAMLGLRPATGYPHRSKVSATM